MVKAGPWWRCQRCKEVFKVKIAGLDDIPKPPDDDIPEVGICMTCLEKSKIEQKIKAKGGYQPQLL